MIRKDEFPAPVSITGHAVSWRKMKFKTGSRLAVPGAADEHVQDNPLSGRAPAGALSQRHAERIAAMPTTWGRKHLDRQLTIQRQTMLRRGTALISSLESSAILHIRLRGNWRASG